MAVSCIQSSLLLFKELPKRPPENERGRQSQLQQKKPMSGRAGENEVYFSGISQKIHPGSCKPCLPKNLWVWEPSSHR